jgi:hypothetical protein
MKLREIYRLMRTLNFLRSRATLALIMLPLAALAVAAQDEPKPQERVSKPDEIQTGAKKIKAASAIPMTPEKRQAATPVNGKTLRMEEALKTPQRVSEGKRQTAVNYQHAESPKAGEGEQKPRTVVEPKAPGSHLQLVLKISSAGTAEVVSAKEVAGPAVTSQTGPGRWVYAVFSGEKAIAAQGIPNPFEMRSFAPPPGSPLEGQGHHIEQAQTALVPVAVPNISLKSPALAQLSVRLYQLKEGAPLLHVDPSILQKLEQDQRLEMKVRIPAATLNRQIRMRAPAATTTPQ